MTRDRSDAVAVPAPDPDPDPDPAQSRRGGTVLFQIPFTRAMSDADLAQLARALDLSTHMYAKQRPDPTVPGVARLDHFSGLYLERGPTDQEWLLEGRTWGHPAPATVHRWLVLAAEEARRLDPTVTVPERLPAQPDGFGDQPVGEVANRRLAARRRHLVGLP